MQPIEQLREHSEEFRKEIIALAPNVFGAVGYAASNVYMLVGQGGVIIIDTTESTTAAQNILTEFRLRTELPVRAIIYTHSHRDHICGARIFADNDAVQIIASHRFKSDLIAPDNTRPAPGKALMQRTARQFGMGLDFPDERINLGCGPGDRPMEGLGAGFVPPDHLVEDESIRLQICGIDLELTHAPGETDDHLVVWYQEKGILFCGDNFYRSFPNLYAIRGTAYRDFEAWAASLDLLIAYQANILAPGHSRPVVGSDNVMQVLSDYRDAIRHVIEATVAGMNAGEGPDKLAHSVTLPECLAKKPHLKEFYGKVSWAVRAYFSGTLGWFDGNPTSLERLAPYEEAQRFIQIAGGTVRLMEEVHTAIARGDFQWSCELLDRLLLVEYNTHTCRRLKAQCLRALADAQINATARNYYLVCARQLMNDPGS